ncbi:integral membrane protein [Acephala macrosclerotiorum]|nr:integral membrane protein [Acephala macrosclerotiorum]
MTDSGISKSVAESSSITIAIACFLIIAFYNVAELNFIILGTFKRRQGLYFWSFLISTWGIAIHDIGFLLKDFQISSQSGLYVTLIIVGWCCMVTGQSVVLYSRLHLVVRNPGILRLVLIMIIVDAIICHIPITVLIYGANSNNPGPFVLPYSIYEKVQVTIFFIQELTISALYIVETVKILRPESNIRGNAPRKVMAHLLYVNAIIVLLDVTILALEYSGLYNIQTAYKAFVYSLKLKLEFSILNRLVDLTRSGNSSGYIQSSSRLGERDGGVYMETFDGTRRDRQSKQHDQRAGYSAYVRPGTRENGAASDANKDNSVVVLTTEIDVYSGSTRGDGNSGRDWDSIDERSGVTGTPGTAEKGDDIRVLSSSSSQTRFAIS